MYTNIFLILALPSLALADLADVTCVDCEKVTGRDCKIKKTGYGCFPTDYRLTKMKAPNITMFEGDPPEGFDMDVCIPSSLEIKEVDNYCCVWSPEKGCQLLRGARVPKTALECVRCTVQDLNTPKEPVCPCVDKPTPDSAQRCVFSALLLVMGVIWSLKYIIKIGMAMT